MSWPYDQEIDLPTHDQFERALRELTKAWTTLHDDLQAIANELRESRSNSPPPEILTNVWDK